MTNSDRRKTIVLSWHQMCSLLVCFVYFIRVSKHFHMNCWFCAFCWHCMECVKSLLRWKFSQQHPQSDKREKGKYILVSIKILVKILERNSVENVFILYEYGWKNSLFHHRSSVSDYVECFVVLYEKIRPLYPPSLWRHLVHLIKFQIVAKKSAHSTCEIPNMSRVRFTSISDIYFNFNFSVIHFIFIVVTKKNEMKFFFADFSCNEISWIIHVVFTLLSFFG